MARALLVASFIGCIGWHYANAFLTVIPRDTESKVNDTTYFNCSTNITSKEIHWSHGAAYVYAGGTFYFPYLERFNVTINTSTGAYNLVIVGVQPQDVGEYSCQDDGGHGKQSESAKLIVLADEPTCLTNFIRSGDVCGIDPDEVQLSCSVGYHGNIPPQLEWRKAGENSPIGNAISVQSGSNITHSVTLKTDLSMNGQSYVCQTKQSTRSQYRCNSEKIRLNYVFGGDEIVNTTIDKEIKCSANSSNPCNYKWISENDSHSVSTDQTLKPTRLGSHRCEATCDFGNRSCTVVVMFVEVLPAATTEGSGSTDASSSSSTSVIVGVVMGVAIAVVVIIGVFIVCCWIHRRSKSKHGADTETMKTEQSTTPLIALNSDDDKQVKKSDTEPNKEDVVINQSDKSMPLINSKADDKEQVKQSHTETDQGPKVLSLLEGKPQYVSTIERGSDRKKPITGLTVLKDKLFVAAEDSSALQIYDVTNECALLRKVLIPEMVNPYDLSSCHIIECVFIIDSKVGSEPKEIFRLESTETIGKRWSTGDDFGNMSVSSESNVILCVTDKRKLIEYTKDGEKIRDISLPDKVHPQHAMKLTNGNFVISHGKRNGLLHQVCIVNTSGDVVKLVKSFGKEYGHSLLQLNEPKYLIVDKEGSVLVVDRNNNRVLLLDSDLNAKRDFLKEVDYGVKNPDKMCLCEATRNLFMVTSTNTVLILSIK